MVLTSLLLLYIYYIMVCLQPQGLKGQMTFLNFSPPSAFTEEDEKLRCLAIVLHQIQNEEN